MNSPTTFFEWKQMLDKFAEGDDSMLSMMKAGTMSVDAGTVSRFLPLINDTYQKRKSLWLIKFNRLLQQPVKSVSDIEAYISFAKSGLKILIDFCNLKAFPADITKTLMQDLRSSIEEIKRSIKEKAARDRQNHMNSLLLIFDNLGISKIDGNNSLQDSEAQAGVINKKRIIF